MKRTAAMTVALFGALILTAVFQNCAGYQTGYNPLTDGTEQPSCLGASCTTNLDFVEVRVTNNMPVGIYRPSSLPSTGTCDATNCVDIAGYCNTAGFPGSRFYYQWRLNNAPIISRTVTTVVCDNMGRFRIRVPVPKNGFDYSGTMYSLDISMTVIDEYGVETESPSGIATKNVPVTGVDLPST